MIRILHYIGLLEFGGSQSFVMELYRKIDRSKIQFDFVTFPNQKDGFYKEIIDMDSIESFINSNNYEESDSDIFNSRLVGSEYY